MGTRSNTVVIETGNEGKEAIFVNIYRQMDGYLSCHGKMLADFMQEIVLCNGIGLGKKNTKYANGAGCFAAQLIAALKDDVGGIYIDTPTKAASIGVNDYTYVIRIDTYTPSKGIDVQVLEYGKQIFRGDSVKYAAFVEEQATAEA
jgi:hypothetical protein